MARFPAHIPSRQMQQGSVIVAVSGRPLPSAERRSSSSRSSRFQSGAPPSADNAWNIRPPLLPAADSRPAPMLSSPLVPIRPQPLRLVPAEAGRTRGRGTTPGLANEGLTRLKADAEAAESGCAHGHCQLSPPMVRGRSTADAQLVLNEPVEPQLASPRRASLSRAACSCPLPSARAASMTDASAVMLGPRPFVPPTDNEARPMGCSITFAVLLLPADEGRCRTAGAVGRGVGRRSALDDTAGCEHAGEAAVSVGAVSAGAAIGSAPREREHSSAGCVEELQCRKVVPLAGTLDNVAGTPATSRPLASGSPYPVVDRAHATPTTPSSSSTAHDIPTHAVPATNAPIPN
eukprot:scaffold62423_cov30-Tisochrysis_lutea.AAC.3